jgi:type IV pilus assembly protein PilQ
MTAGRISRLLLVLVLLSVLTACSVPGGQVKSTEGSQGEILGIQVHDLQEKTEIVVEGQQPMIYTTFRLTDPLRLVVDMAGVTLGPSVSEIAVNNGTVTTVLPKAVEGTKVSRLEVGLAESVESNVRTEGTNLIIEVNKPATAKNEEAPSTEVAEATAPSEETSPPTATAEGGAPPGETSPSTESTTTSPEPPIATSTPVHEETMPKQETMPKAKVIKRIRGDKNGSLKVIITADGELDPKAFFLGKNRLVIDFMGVTTSMGPRLISIKNNPQVRRVRLGKHPDKVRLVADLAKPISYQFDQEKDNLIVSILPAEEMPPSAVSAGETSKASPMPPASQAGSNQEAVKSETASPDSMPMQVESAEVEARAGDEAVSNKGTTVSQQASESAAPDEAARPEASPEEPKKTAKSKSAARKATSSPLKAKPSSKKVKSTAPMQSVGTGAAHHYVGRRISLDFQDADITNVIRLIADVSGLNIVVGDDVKGKVTLKLTNVPWDQALELILKMNDLGQIREGNIVRIATLANITRQQDEEAKAKETQIKAEDLEMRVLRVNYAVASKIAEPLKKHLSVRGEITFDDRTNTLVVKDVPKHLEEIVVLAKSLDTQTPQVMIEARIVQVNPTFDRSLGIQWGGNLKTITNTSQFGVQGTQGTTGPSGIAFGTTSPDFAVNLPAATSTGSIGFTLGRFTGNPFNLDLRLSAGEVQGLTRIVSTPKVSVLDNQEAKIEQGETIPYATTSASGTQTIFVDATLSLTVKPHITGDRSVIMSMKIAKDAPGETRPGAAGPSISKKEANTYILLKDGETMVIGGIYETTRINSVSGVPFLMRIPFLGWLFKTEEQREDKTELLVFITPRIL